MNDSEGSTDGDKAESWGWFAKHYSQYCFSTTADVKEVNTHLDSINPGRFLIGTE
jgi:hypothetical protein